MKKLFLSIFIVGFVIASCNRISNKPVSQKLSTSELSKAVESDTTFSYFYENIRKSVEEISDIKKAKYNEVTYDRIFTYFKFITDTAYWKPLIEKWEGEWTSEFAVNLSKADSALKFWRKYLEINSLNKYVNIELARIDKSYYEYIGGLKEVQLGFRLTPILGGVEQIRFTYGYKAKINGDDKYYEKHSCISTSPFSSPTTRFWEVEYSNRNTFGGENVESFLRDYNLYINITSIRKDGININIDDISVPAKIAECFEYEKDYPALFKLSREELIKEIINNDYVTKSEYVAKKTAEVREEKDKLCFDFLKDAVFN